MTIAEAIASCDAQQPNAYSAAEKRRWLSELDGQMEQNATDYQKLQELAERRAAAEETLNGLYERWEELSTQIEELQS